MIPVRPGSVLSINWRHAGGFALQHLKRLKLDFRSNGGVDVMAVATFVDDHAVSVYIKRGAGLGGDIEARIPKHQFGEYFEATPRMVTGYISSRHFEKTFPSDI